jgi:hypothetical protein
MLNCSSLQRNIKRFPFQNKKETFFTANPKKSIDSVGMIIDSPASNLEAAVLNNHIDLARQSLRNGADPNTGDLLLIAVRRGNFEMVKLLLESGANSDNGRVFQSALFLGSPEIAGLVIDSFRTKHFIDADLSGIRLNTPAIVYIFHHHTSDPGKLLGFLKVLVDRGADVNRRSLVGTALDVFLAWMSKHCPSECYAEYDEILEILLRAGARTRLFGKETFPDIEDQDSVGFFGFVGNHI